MYRPGNLTVSFLVLAAILALICAACFALQLFWSKFGVDRYGLSRFIAASIAAIILIALICISVKDPLNAILPKIAARFLFHGIAASVIFLLFFFKLNRGALFMNIILHAACDCENSII